MSDALLSKLIQIYLNPDGTVPNAILFTYKNDSEVFGCLLVYMYIYFALRDRTDALARNTVANIIAYGLKLKNPITKWRVQQDGKESRIDLDQFSLPFRQDYNKSVNFDDPTFDEYYSFFAFAEARQYRYPCGEGALRFIEQFRVQIQSMFEDYMEENKLDESNIILN